MAEHPTHQNRSGDSPGRREGNNQAFEDLRSLLLAPEQKEIADLRQRIEVPVVRAEEVSSVVAEAIELRREHGGSEDLNKALTPSVEEALRESVRKDPSVLAGALFPVMGPAIRRSITESIRAMLESFNQALEHSLSIQGVRWRFESLRTGKAFAEIVLLHSLIYRVEQVFLIHKATGLMLAHCVAARVATQDPTLVSGMFSAIQSYVRDSFKAPKEDSLDSLQVGELEVWVEAGPQAILAAVIRGHAPASYRATLEKTIEDIHRDFGLALEEFNGDSAPFAAAEPRLELCLESHYQPRKSMKRKPYFSILALVLVILAIGIWAAIALWKQSAWDKYVENLQKKPGIVVTSSGTEHGHYVVRGLRDPLADEPDQMDSNLVTFQWKPFYSLDDSMIGRHANEMLQPPKTVSLTVSEGVLHAEGQAPSNWVRSLKDRASLVPGVKKLDASRLQETNGPESALTSVIFTFPLGIAQAEPGQDAKFETAAEQINLLLAKATPPAQYPTIEVVGHTDTSGTESLNLSLSQQRAEYVTRKLIDAGIARRYLNPRGVATSEPVQSGSATHDDRLERSVTLRILPSKPNQVQ
jgi:outer membrane protein OmpA-like peptidoglycan-associated protein